MRINLCLFFVQNFWILNKMVYICYHKQTNKDKMTNQELKTQIEKLAKEENITFIAACQAMQGAASTMGNEKMIAVIHEIKMASL